MIELRHVDHYASASGVDRSVAERDVVLTYVLKLMKEDGVLEKLALKGGTCIRKIYLGRTGRFSEDLDFTLLGGDLNEFDDLFTVFVRKARNHGFTLSIDNFRKSWGESYACDLHYTHEWGSGSLKFEVSLREEPALGVVYRGIYPELYFRYTGFETFEIPCMRLEEVLAEKIRATYQRTTTRDIYDLYQFALRPYDRALVKRLVVMKFWNIRSDYSPRSLLEKLMRRRISFEDLEYLIKDKEHPPEHEIKEAINTNYSYLEELDNDYRRILGDVKRHEEQTLVKAKIAEMRTR